MRSYTEDTTKGLKRSPVSNTGLGAHLNRQCNVYWTVTLVRMKIG
jgi:hypothetical protein